MRSWRWGVLSLEGRRDRAALYMKLMKPTNRSPYSLCCHNIWLECFGGACCTTHRVLMGRSEPTYPPPLPKCRRIIQPLDWSTDVKYFYYAGTFYFYCLFLLLFPWNITFGALKKNQPWPDLISLAQFCGIHKMHKHSGSSWLLVDFELQRSSK